MRHANGQTIRDDRSLSVLGAGLGIPLACALVTYAKSRPTLSVPLLHRVEVDGWALAFTALLAVGSGVAFGLLPAARIVSTDPAAALLWTSQR